MPKVILHFKLFLLLLFFSISGFSQDYKMLRDSFECGASNSYSIYATAEDVDLLAGYIDECGTIEYLKVIGYKPGSHWDLLFSILGEMENLKGIELYYNEGLQAIPKKITKNENLKVITIVGNRRLDYDDLFKKLSKLKQLESVTLMDNKLKEVPESIGELKGLKKLKVSGNEQLNYEALIKEIASNEYLEELSIPLNSISDIPENVSNLRKLKVLDIRKNYIAEFPNSISSLDSLEFLRAEENIILDVPNELNKLKNLNIKYISFDVEAGEEEMKGLKEIFPSAEIDGKKIADHFEEIEKDNLNSEGVQFNSDKVKECWDAINEYNSLFKRKYTYSDFDSSLFYSRLTNIDYCYNDRVLADGSFEGTRLLLHNKFQLFHKDVNYPRFKLNKGEIGFSICPEGNLYPELKAFTGMVWIYVGGKSEKDFYKSFVKNKEWKDVYLEFDQSKNTFFVVLKNEHLEKIPVYPRYINRNSSVKDAQKQYDKKFRMYEKRLSLRAKRFDESIQHEIVKHQRILKKMNTVKWQKLKKYMCDYEKGLSKDGWLQYKDYLIAKEHQILDTVPANDISLQISCKVKRIQMKENSASTFKEFNINSVEGSFNLNIYDSVQILIPKAKIYFYYPEQATVSYFNLAGSNGIQFSNNLNFVVILEVNNRYIILKKKDFLRECRASIGEKGVVNLFLLKPYLSYNLDKLWGIVKNAE